jgi:hypothetical protein
MSISDRIDQGERGPQSFFVRKHIEENLQGKGYIGGGLQATGSFMSHVSAHPGR